MKNNDEMLMRKRHSLAHLLGASLIELYPGTKLAIGPPVDDGFLLRRGIAGAVVC